MLSRALIRDILLQLQRYVTGNHFTLFVCVQMRLSLYVLLFYSRFTYSFESVVNSQSDVYDVLKSASAWGVAQIHIDSAIPHFQVFIYNVSILQDFKLFIFRLVIPQFRYSLCTKYKKMCLPSTQIKGCTSELIITAIFIFTQASRFNSPYILL